VVIPVDAIPRDKQAIELWIFAATLSAAVVAAMEEEAW